MIITELYDGQGLGNQLWAYTVTRLIAEHKGCPFSIIGTDNFKGRGFMEIDFGVDPVIEHLYTEKNEIFEGHSMWPYDPELYNVPLNTKIDGNFQSYQYVRGYEDKIRGWFKIRNENKTDENTCVIHFRAGDYLGIPDVFLPKEYYQTAMNEVLYMNPDVKFVCVSDMPDIAEMYLGVPCISDRGKDKNMAAHHHGGDISIDFSYIMNAEYLIIPNSSFAWWGAFLNTKKKIVVAPMFWAGRNKGFWQTSDIESDGFIYV